MTPQRFPALRYLVWRIDYTEEDDLADPNNWLDEMGRAELASAVEAKDMGIDNAAQRLQLQELVIETYAPARYVKDMHNVMELTTPEYVQPKDGPIRVSAYPRVE